MPARLLPLLLGLLCALCAAWLAGAPQPAAGGALPAVEFSAPLQAAELLAERVAGTAADGAGETVAPPTAGLRAPAASDRAARIAPRRDAVPRAPCLEGLLRPPCAA